MRYPSTHKEETRKKLIGNARAIAKRGGFGTTGIDELMASIGLTGGAFYGHFPSKEALFAELVEHEISNSADMLAVDESSPPDHVAKKLRSYLSSYHALHPETGCVLPALGPEIARARPEVRAAVEQGLKRLQKSWSGRIGDPGCRVGIARPMRGRAGAVACRGVRAHSQGDPRLEPPLYRRDTRAGREAGAPVETILTAAAWHRAVGRLSPYY